MTGARRSGDGATGRVSAVRSFWESHINNEYYTNKPRASTAYFDEIRDRRYRWHYHLRELFDELTDSKGNLLEIGCGIGVDSIELARCGFHVTAIDLTEAAIDIARRHAAHRNVEVTFQVGNAEALEFSDDCFDWVFSFGVLHHTPNIRQAIAELRRVLKPGGTALIMLYNRHSIVETVHQIFRLPYESPENRADHCPVVHRLTKREAAEYFKIFSAVEISSEYPFTYGFRHVASWMPQWLKRWLGRYIGWHLMIRAVK
jgi:2-polyprenyl-3-methyl-5-hydroxy-6-metoxy-1,4-benzoquinol methylase